MERAYKHGTTYSDGGFVGKRAQKYKYDNADQTEFPSPQTAMLSTTGLGLTV
jgi:hypothetical protein